MAAAQPADPWCGRSRDPDDELQHCEVQRDAQADILDSARRPGARGLGRGVIRFSSRPSLGGRGQIVEFVGNAAGGADVRIITLWSYPGDGWRVERSRNFTLPPEDYRRLAAAVDAAIEDRVLPPPEREGQEQRIVCMDGPGYLTERVANGSVWSYSGFCPPNQDDPHPNEVIASLLRSMLCHRHDPEVRRGYWLGRRCYRPPFTMRSGGTAVRAGTLAMPPQTVRGSRSGSAGSSPAPWPG